MGGAVFWFRSDLRLQDNQALQVAASRFSELDFLVVIDLEAFKALGIGGNQVSFYLASVASLRAEIEARGGSLVVKVGRTEETVLEVVKGRGAAEVFCSRRYEPFCRQQEATLASALQSKGATLHVVNDGMIQPAEAVLKASGEPYRVFTPYKKAWLKTGRPQPVGRAKFASKRLKGYGSEPIPTVQELGFKTSVPSPEAGEKAAGKILAAFLKKGGLGYARNRDLPYLAGTSQLSPHLALGTISPIRVLAEIEKARQAFPAAAADLDVFQSELAWRDFYRQILWHYPRVATESFKPALNHLAWENDKTRFAAWCEGRTGFPIVDAGMRQLKATGWMHNRLRMITATFLCKDLLISYQWGERYFMEKLLDADLAANNGSWQWCASTGTDAQPYFRIFNPLTQARKFDPEGQYIARWVPEVLTREYPAPIVDHAQQRTKALALYRRAS